MNLEQCEVCGGTTAKRKTTAARPYHDVLVGLDKVFLVGIEVIECKKCGAQSPIIPKMGILLETIARDLIFKPGLLSGKELRFLRKQMGKTVNDFAELIGVDPAHLSRVENGKTPALGVATDKLARAVALAGADAKALKNLLFEVPSKAAAASLPRYFGFKESHWQLEKKAA